MMRTSYLYNHYGDVKKKQKLIYFSPNMYRSLYLIYSKKEQYNSEKPIYSRSSKIPIFYINKLMIIHSGKGWHIKYVNRWMIGHSIGEYTWNRKYAIYKAKQMRKKNKKKNKENAKKK